MHCKSKVMSLFVYYRLIVQNSFCQTFAIRDLGQPLRPAGQVTFTCHLPRDKFCKKYLLDPAYVRHQPVRQGQTTTLGTPCSTLCD